MRVDFYQLGDGMGPEGIVAALAGKVVADGDRLLLTDHTGGRIVAIAPSGASAG